MKYLNSYGPMPSDYDTEEEYQEALEAYESALSEAEDEYIERRRERE